MHGLNASRNYCLICLCAALKIFCCTISHAKNYEIEFTAGVEREILNFENESDTLIIRGGSCVKLGNSFKFNYTELRNMNEDTGSYTWNIEIQDIGSFMNFTAGNYTLHFGSGLMMGSKSYSTGDPFNKKISISRDQLISGANGGSPAYPFYGAAAMLYKISDDLRISILPFFSMQRRFITAEFYEEGAIDSSLFTLSSKIKKTYTCTEPVNIINYGAAIEMKTMGLFNFQLYCFDTDLRDESGKDILWDKNKFNYIGGVDLIRNWGFFAEYCDENISIFTEPAMSTVYCDEALTDFAVAWGLAIRNRIMNFSFRGKNTGTDFHSEYSSGGRTPERILEIKYSLTPLKWLETGCMIYSEKDLIHAYNRDYAEGSVQEEIFGSINTGCMNFSLDLKRKEHYSTDRTDPLDRGNLSAGFAFSERFFMKFKVSMQKFAGENSGLAGCEMKLMFWKYCSLSAGYARITVNGDIPFYAVISPAPEHTPAECFRESAHGVSVKFRYRKEKDSFYARFGIIKTGSESEAQAESAAVLVF